MGPFVKGDVVVLQFPFSDLSGSKPRPAFVVTQLNGDDVILCQITAQFREDNRISLKNDDFMSGNLNRDSYIRPDHLFTADSTKISYTAGTIRPEKIEEVISEIINIIRS